MKIILENNAAQEGRFDQGERFTNCIKREVTIKNDMCLTHEYIYLLNKIKTLHKLIPWYDILFMNFAFHHLGQIYYVFSDALINCLMFSYIFNFMLHIIVIFTCFSFAL